MMLMSPALIPDNANESNRKFVGHFDLLATISNDEPTNACVQKIKPTNAVLSKKQ